MKKLAALRGAVCCKNESAEITAKVAALYDDLLNKNGLAESDIVSLIFSVTTDLTVKNPAAALRSTGRAAGAALFAVQEAVCEGAFPNTIRVLAHCYMEETRKPRHVYRDGAESLRPDLAETTEC